MGHVRGVHGGLYPRTCSWELGAARGWKKLLLVLLQHIVVVAKWPGGRVEVVSRRVGEEGMPELGMPCTHCGLHGVLAFVWEVWLLLTAYMYWHLDACDGYRARHPRSGGRVVGEVGMGCTYRNPSTCPQVRWCACKCTAIQGLMNCMQDCAAASKLCP